MNWISVKHQLPQPYVDVLIYPRPSDYCCEAFYDPRTEQWFYGEYEMYSGHVNHKCTVTHWMHLPEDPKEEK